MLLCGFLIPTDRSFQPFKLNFQKWVAVELPQLSQTVLFPDLQSNEGRDKGDLVLDVFCDTTLTDGVMNLFCEIYNCRVDVLLIADDGIARDGGVEEELKLIPVCERAAIMGR
ncbi:hypothetical protein TNIN_68421 [Trichonephila inaurata madagascariensis]|uniref:Uncharacterized protein n=1 Tax=Trichonephila inaurata madagascariensis TaxID=2747483 RepID=A0A8X6XFI2_9ARAC|nr:hypothetical protein TNIN_68421 [Trichonephila inaurata madagascariensis]